MDFSNIELQETGGVTNDKIIFEMLLDKINLLLYWKAITLGKSDDFKPLNDPYKVEQDILEMIFQDNVSVSLFNQLTETIVIHTAVSVDDTKVICLSIYAKYRNLQQMLYIGFNHYVIVF